MKYFQAEATETLFVSRPTAYFHRVNEPLALLLCNRGTIAVQLGERLEGLRYRMVVITEPAELKARAEVEKAMVVFADLEGGEGPVASAVQALRQDGSTAHIPVIGFRRELDEAAISTLASQGFTIAVNEAAILNHLPQLLDRALDVG